ncbi:unnamed protein product [Amoebophrya sp. A25]|nr:unnamed protein product [Amoebophrya sp. A25]CAD7962436.1 unnamed protein product [Amoebophrya sp. A25]|eukprot:GSA25T00019032001.1
MHEEELNGGGCFFIFRKDDRNRTARLPKNELKPVSTLQLFPPA